MPWVYPLPPKRDQPISIFLNSGKYFVIASVLRTSLSIVSNQLAERPAGSASCSKVRVDSLRIYLVLANTSHTFFLMRQSTPLNTEKQTSFLEQIDRSQVRIMSPHYSKLNARPSHRLPMSRKSLMYMFSTPSCSTSAGLSSPRMMKSSLGFSSRISSTISSKLLERNWGA